MAQPAKRYCLQPGCPEIIVPPAAYCRHHTQIEKAIQQKYEKRNPAYSTGVWKRARAFYRKDHPICEVCNRKPTAIIHHRKAIEDGGELLAYDNLQAVCRLCHGELHGGRGG